MRKVVLLLSVWLGVSVLSGCSYMEDKAVEKMRAELKKDDIFKIQEKDLDMMRDMGIYIKTNNQYPLISMTMTVKEVNVTDIPKEYTDTFNKELSQGLCNLEVFKQYTPTERKLIARLIEEDNITVELTINDKVGREISKGKQVIAKCPGFSELTNG